MPELPDSSRALKGLMVLALVAYLLVKGVIPAFTAITDDFPEYFTSATVARKGDAAKLYDGAWFREQTRRYRVGTQANPGMFSPYPPPTALLLMPLTGFEPLTALRIVTTLNLLLLFASAVLLSRIFAWRLVDSALFILLSGWALHSGLRFGHPYILISTLCLLGYYLYLKHMPWLGGLCLGVFVPIKYYPLSLLAGFTFYRKWRVLLGAVAAIGAVMLASIWVLGWDVHQIFLRDVFFSHLRGHLNPPDSFPSFAAQHQSFDTLFARLFILDPVRNPRPWLAVPLAQPVAVLATKGLLTLAAGVALLKLSRDGAATMAPAIGILGALMMLLAPGTGTYAAVLLWLPVALLVDYFRSEGAYVQAYLILGCYILVGFIPYGHTAPFEGRGGLTILAYPRLLLLLVMFVISVHAAVYPWRSGRRAVPLVP